MAGCRIHLKNQLAEEQGERELTEREREIVNTPDDQLEDVAPTKYGPLSDFDGSYCRFCHRMGQIGALVFGVTAALIVWWSIQNGTIDVPNWAIGVAGIGVWAPLAYITGVNGYFPILGPRLGPYVEGFLANLGIYVTATARKEYEEEPNSTEPEDEITIDEIEMESTDLPDDYLKSKNHEVDELKRKIQRLKEEKQRYQKLAEKRKKDKNQKKTELETVKDEKKSLAQKRQQLESKIEEVQQEKQQLQQSIQLGTQSGITKGPTNVSPDDAVPVVTQHETGDYVGFFWMLKVVDYKHPGFNQTIPIPFGVWNLEELDQIPTSIPDVMEREDVPEFEDYLIFDPRRLDQPIDVKSTAHPKYEEGDVALFHGDLGNVEELRKEALSPEDRDADFNQAILKLGLDTAGNPVPTEADVRGFERRQELRNQKQKFKRQFRQIKHQAEQQKEHIEELRHDYQILENERDQLQDRLAHLRDREKRSRQAAMSLEQNQELHRQQRSILERDLEQREHEVEELDEKRKEHRKEAFEESDRLQQEVAEYESRSDATKREHSAIEEILEVWEHPELDDTEAKNGDKKQFIRDFLDADGLNQAASKKQKEMINRFVGDA
jgi:DNA repair exonuclease SbcCD ATPase subunit